VIPESRLNYLLAVADRNTGFGDPDVRQLSRGLREVAEELRRMYERAQAVEGVLADAIETGKPLGILKVHEALRGPAEAPATTEELVLWAKYFSNDENAVKGWSMPQAGFRDKYKMLALRCNYCAYLSGGLVHMNWHEGLPAWRTERLLEERKEKLG
jgi:hypothetical protein